MNPYDENLMKALNCIVTSVARLVMNVCDLRKADLENVDKVVKNAKRNKKCLGKRWKRF